jgi:tetratricopeptide (TPR) repeat protein
MKSTLVSLLLLFFCIANLHAQGRRRLWSPASVPSAGSGTGSLESIPPRAESNPPHLNPAGSNLVAVSQLHIPSKAIKEFELSQKAIQKHDINTSVEHLQKALHIYPDFIQAHDSLGLRFIQLGDFPKALAEHQTALALDQRSAESHQDLSFTLLLLNRSQEAEAEAREALDLEPRLIAPRYFLARALIAQGHANNEAIEMLQQSEGAFPNASLVLAQIHFVARQTDQVVADLRRYLRTPEDPENKQKAECWVAHLTEQPLRSSCPADFTRPAFH